MKVHIGGTRNGVLWPPAGGVKDDLPENEARELIEGGLAEAVEPPKVEKPEARPVQKRAEKRG